MDEEDLNEVGGHCPRCGQEYRPGFFECADCRLPLHAGPAPAGGEWAEPGPPPPDQPAEDPFPVPAEEPWSDAGEEPGEPSGPLVRVGSYPRREALLVSGLLEGAGIHVAYRPWSPHVPSTSAYGEMLDPAFEVLVPEERLDEARALLEEGATPRFEENGH